MDDAIITINGKRYQLVKPPVLKTMDKEGYCSIFGFKEIDDDKTTDVSCADRDRGNGRR